MNTNLLGRGNGKLGEGIHTWSLPAAVTCPGRSPSCESVCYALAGRYRTQQVQLALHARLAACNEPAFVGRMVREIRRRCVHVVRIHASGDFFSAAYVRDWVKIATRCKNTRFYGYTRSWRMPRILPALYALAALPNVRLWFSCDADTGLPPTSSIPPGVKVCWLQTTTHDEPPMSVAYEQERVSLVFRAKPVRSGAPATFPLSLVCPPERPQRPDTTCGECGRCWRDLPESNQ